MAEKLKTVPRETRGLSTSKNDDYFSGNDMPASGGMSQTRQLAAISPTSPRTPRTPFLGRTASSNFNSPGQGFRADDEFFIFEFGSRFLRAGLGGERQPRCRLSFGPDLQNRAGDYIQRISGANTSPASYSDVFDSWDSDHVLWRMDLRETDLGLVRDKVERALRRAIVDYLLVLDESKKRKYILAVPAVIPQPFLSTLLSALFNVCTPPPSIVLVSSAVLDAVAAGLRSALVVNIGWAETTVTGVYEYREVEYKSSRRAMKLVSWEMRAVLEDKIQNKNAEAPTRVLFQDVEDVLHRVAWCRKRGQSATPRDSSTQGSNIEISLESQNPVVKLSVPFFDLSDPVEKAFFPVDEDGQSKYDDEECPPSQLLFNALLSLPIDVRRICLSRIVITGGGSNIPGLKARLLDELSQIVYKRGWDPVENYGSAKNPKDRTIPVHTNGQYIVDEKTELGAKFDGHTNKDLYPETESATYQQPPLPDPILASLNSRSSSNQPMRGEERSSPVVSNQHAQHGSSGSEERLHVSEKIQGALSLGSWAGASLVAGLRVRGQVEIDRETFIQHGLAGASQPSAPKRQSTTLPPTQRHSLVGGATGAAASRPGDRDSGTWTLGVWA